MTTDAPARFHWRAFVTLYVTLSFLLAASGIVLYVAPPGRVANWSRWTLAALDRSGWQALHTVAALLFVLAGAFHLWFNWRVFWFHVRTRLAAGVRLRWEPDAAGVTGARPQATTAAVASTNGLTPQRVWKKLEGREKPKEIPAGGGYGGKVVAEVCDQLEVSLDECLARLRAQGDRGVRGHPMKDLAERLGRRPHDLVDILAGA